MSVSDAWIPLRTNIEYERNNLKDKDNCIVNMKVRDTSCLLQYKYTICTYLCKGEQYNKPFL